MQLGMIGLGRMGGSMAILTKSHSLMGAAAG